MKCYKTIIAATTILISTNVCSALIDNGLFTTDTSTGLDWLDLTESRSLSYNYVSSQLSAGGEFDGWSLASVAQVETFFDNAGGVRPYDGLARGAGGANTVSTLLSLWGTTNSNGIVDEVYFTTGDVFDSLSHISGAIHHFKNGGQNLVAGFGAGEDWLYVDILPPGGGSHPRDTASGFNSGFTLIRNTGVSSVPIPAAAWLFGSGLIGLFGFAKRKL